MKKTKKCLALCLAAVTAASLLGGCAGQNANATSAAVSTAAAEEGQSGAAGSSGAQDAVTEAAGMDGDIIIAVSSLGNTMDPVDTTDATSSALVYAAYDRLIKYGVKEKDGKLYADISDYQPSIAKSWDVSDDQLTWTFHIDENAKFSNGDPVTAEDVAYSFDRCKTRPNGEFVYGLTNIKETNVIDDHTVEFTLSQHCSIFLRLIEMYTFGITDKSQVEENGDDWLTNNTAGSGPYELTKYDNASEVVVTRRDDYWGEAPKNHSVTFKKVAEVSNRQLMLEKGDVDMALDISEKDLEGLAQKDGVKVQTDSSVKIVYLALNSKIAPFDNKLVRQAMGYALPYDSMVNDIMYGRATKMTSSFVPTIMDSHKEGTAYTQDLDKAKSLLAEAGYPDGFSFDLTLGSGFQDWEDDAVLIQAELSKVGITMNINKVERPQFLEMAAGKNVQAFITRFISFVNDPGYLSGCILNSKGDFNYYNFDNAEFDALYEQAQSTLDEKERMECFEKMQDIVHDEAPILGFYEYGYTMSYRDGISGYTFYPDLTVRFENLQK